MVLECTVICLDNSEWMRNGDYVPTRFEAQQDAASLISTARCEQNPENTVGLLAMSNGVELLVSPTDEVAKVLGAFSQLSVGGKVDFAAAVQIAQLALKHRRNKNGGQRIIVFVGSPIENDAKTLEKIGKQLKKNNVAVDVVSMGELDENNAKLEVFINAANSNDNSHLISVPPGMMPSEAVLSSTIIHGEEGGAAAAATYAEYGGIDPNLDPELAMAIRMSTEEARAAEEARARAAAASSSGAEATPTQAAPAAAAPAPASSAAPAPAPTPAPATGGFADDDDEMLQQALAMSMQEYASSQQQPQETAAPAPAPAPAAAAPAPAAAAPVDAEDDEDAAIRRAMELSMAEQGTPQQQGQEFMDADFVRGLLSSVEGVDMSDPMVQAALAQVTGSRSAEEKKESEDKKDQDKTDKQT